MGDQRAQQFDGDTEEQARQWARLRAEVGDLGDRARALVVEGDTVGAPYGAIAAIGGREVAERLDGLLRSLDHEQRLRARIAGRAPTASGGR